VAVGPDHHPAWKRILFQNHLVDDTGAGLPESDAVTPTRTVEKAVDLGIDLFCGAQIGNCTYSCLDEVIAVDGGRNRNSRQIGLHELENRHLGGRILHRNPVGAQVGVTLPPLGEFSPHRVEMARQDLLGECQSSRQLLTRHSMTPGRSLVEPANRIQSAQEVPFWPFRGESFMTKDPLPEQPSP